MGQFRARRAPRNLYRPGQAKSNAHATDPYAATFDQIDGRHPWQDQVPDGYIAYPVRRLHYGKVVYFNFALAKEMGLIPEDHPHKMNRQLETKILETFNLRIINEYDQNSGVRFHPAIVKRHKYMATRYLQLQHSDKRGRTSGDGRSIWNGVVHHKGQIWDVSSRGTGVTCLSPGAVEAGKPLRSGSTAYGYGCGLADLDELYGAAIMAEIFHNNGINTERVLTVIDHGDGNGIGVRAGKNLFRPAHLFLHLKQNNLVALKQATDFFIERQHKNREWDIDPHHPKKYEHLLNHVCESFAKFTAQLDREYIFAWLDWDGDNVLGNAGIIDYGSIRQFGLRHDEYRYDDVDRFSTTLKQQKEKARLIIQVFAQLTHYLTSGTKEPLDHFKNHPILAKFDSTFEYYNLDHFLKQLGISKPKRELLMQKNRKRVEELFRTYSRLESVKTRRRRFRVPDGINRPAILNMRKMIVEMPRFLIKNLKSDPSKLMPPREFYRMALAESASRRDKRPSQRVLTLIKSFQTSYCRLMKLVVGTQKPRLVLKNIHERASEINPTDRITGDGLLFVVDVILKTRKKRKKLRSIQEAIDHFIEQQSISPEKSDTRISQLSPGATELVQTFITLVDGHKESI